ncbi:MAG: co-chaperone DjlA [Xanthomonadales bacterium]|nr:co-chaperone DjlA [Xanthomonadales bacterium]
MGNTGFKIPGHWWGKLIGGVIGLMRGGFMGLVLGVFIGHWIDRFLAGLGNAGRTRDAFFGAMFSTLGHINKADGRVTKAEIEAAEQLMRRLQLTEAERQRAIRYFQQGKEQGFDLAGTLREFARHSMLRHELRIMFVELLLEAAVSDGAMTAAEQAILVQACQALHIPANVFNAMLRARQVGGGSAYSGQQRPTSAGQSLQQSYATLGLNTDASAQEVKRAYRKLVSQYHPDKLVSQGLPDEMMEVSKKRVREINAAYDTIKASRGIK